MKESTLIIEQGSMMLKTLSRIYSTERYNGIDEVIQTLSALVPAFPTSAM